MLVPADEFAHTPSAVENWQENYVWHAWDPTTRTGWNLHLGNISAQGLVDVRAHVVIDGEVTAANHQEPGSDSFAATGLDVDIVVPLEKVRLRYEGRGQHGPDAGGWYGRTGGDVPFGFEIEMITEHAPFDNAAYAISAGSADLAGNHYEMGARWTGRVWSGDRSVDVSGLLVRDHSWGGRVWPWDQLFWVPMVFDEGRRFCFNWAERVDGAWRGMSVQLDDTGTVDVAEDFWVRLGGPAVPRQFASAEVLRVGAGASQKYTLHGEIHLPVGRAHSRVGLSDMWSTVHGPEGPGFSTIQLFPSEADVAAGFAAPHPRFA